MGLPEFFRTFGQRQGQQALPPLPQPVPGGMPPTMAKRPSTGVMPPAPGGQQAGAPPSAQDRWAQFFAAQGRQMPPAAVPQAGLRRPAMPPARPGMMDRLGGRGFFGGGQRGPLR